MFWVVSILLLLLPFLRSLRLLTAGRSWEARAAPPAPASPHATSDRSTSAHRAWTPSSSTLERVRFHVLAVLSAGRRVISRRKMTDNGAERPHEYNETVKGR